MQTEAQARQALADGQARFESVPAEWDDDGLDVDDLTDEVIAVIGRACRAKHDANACADLLREAARMLMCLADEVEEA